MTIQSRIKSCVDGICRSAICGRQKRGWDLCSKNRIGTIKAGIGALFKRAKSEAVEMGKLRTEAECKVKQLNVLLTMIEGKQDVIHVGTLNQQPFEEGIAKTLSGYFGKDAVNMFRKAARLFGSSKTEQLFNN